MMEYVVTRDVDLSAAMAGWTRGRYRLLVVCERMPSVATREGREGEGMGCEQRRGTRSSEWMILEHLTERERERERRISLFPLPSIQKKYFFYV